MEQVKTDNQIGDFKGWVLAAPNTDAPTIVAVFDRTPETQIPADDIFQRAWLDHLASHCVAYQAGYIKSVLEGQPVDSTAFTAADKVKFRQAMDDDLGFRLAMGALRGHKSRSRPSDFGL